MIYSVIGTGLEHSRSHNSKTWMKGISAGKPTILNGKEMQTRCFSTDFPTDFQKKEPMISPACLASQERQDAMYKMFGAEYEAPQSKLYAELEGEQVGIDLMTTKNAEKLSCGHPMNADEWMVYCWILTVCLMVLNGY